MQIKTAEQLYNRVVELTTNSKIKREDKLKTMANMSPIKENLPKLQQFVTNSMFKYQGMGIK